jgi:hypothetical protein
MNRLLKGFPHPIQWAKSRNHEATTTGGVQGNTRSERMSNALRTVPKIPKETILRAGAKRSAQAGTEERKEARLRYEAKQFLLAFRGYGGIDSDRVFAKMDRRFRRHYTARLNIWADSVLS